MCASGPVTGRGPYRSGAEMKNNVRILVTLAAAVALFFVIVHYFPQGPGK